MQFRKLLLIIVILSFFYITLSISDTNHKPDNLSDFCPDRRLCFNKPTDLIPVDVLNIDSISGRLKNNKISLVYDLSPYFSTFSELSIVSSEPIIIDGYEGRLLIHKKNMALSIPNISGKIGFSIQIEFKNIINLKQGMNIFKSIKFNL